MIHQQKSRRRIEILHAVHEAAEKFYDTSQELGILAAAAFQEQKENQRERHRAQMTGLENIAETTMKVSDVLDYIKKQTARQPGWHKKRPVSELLDDFENARAQEYADRCFGEILKEYIEKDLAERCTTICGSLGINPNIEEDQRDQQQVFLQLIRQLVRQLVVHYEYKISPWVRQNAAEKQEDRP